MINNETYLISFTTGCCGVFIKTILEQILAQDHIAYQRVIEFPNTHAHDVSFWNNSEGDSTFYPFMPASTIDDKKDYQSILTTYDDKPLTYREHNAPNWESFFSIFPNGKNIVITFSEKMTKYIVNFAYHKLGKNYELNTYNTHMFPFSYKYPLVVPNEYKDKVFEIKLEDILFNKEKVLGLLSIITNKPIPNFVDKTYDNYIKAQKETYTWLFN